jgi:hypothetical protein
MRGTEGMHISGGAARASSNDPDCESGMELPAQLRHSVGSTFQRNGHIGSESAVDSATTLLNEPGDETHERDT